MGWGRLMPACWNAARVGGLVKVRSAGVGLSALSVQLILMRRLACRPGAWGGGVGWGVAGGVLRRGGSFRFWLRGVWWRWLLLRGGGAVGFRGVVGCSLVGG